MGAALVFAVNDIAVLLELDPSLPPFILLLPLATGHRPIHHHVFHHLLLIFVHNEIVLRMQFDDEC